MFHSIFYFTFPFFLLSSKSTWHHVTCLVQIEKIRLGQEGTDKGLFVEEVEIKAPGKEPVLFPCRCWLDNEERDLAPNETVTPAEDSK